MNLLSDVNRILTIRPCNELIQQQSATPVRYNSTATTLINRSSQRSLVNSSNRNLVKFLNTSSQISSNKSSSITGDPSQSTTSTLSDIKTPSNIDDFRAREELREQQQDEESTPTELNEEKINEVRTQILNASLQFVATNGWTRETIAKGAEHIGYPGVVHGMFPNGGIELIQYFYLSSNQKLIHQLSEEVNASNPNEPIDIVVFVTRAIQLRLEMNKPYLAHWPQALAIMSLPPNVPTSLAQLLTLVDDICFYAGDRSVDVSSIIIIHYPKSY